MADGHAVLTAWLGHVNRNPSPYSFEVTDLPEQVSPTPEIVAGLGEIFVRAKAKPEVLERMAQAVGWDDAMVRLRRGRKGVRRGDFGEAVACETLEVFNGLRVPIRKLRYQLDPEQTLPGTDIVGFHLKDDGSIADLHFMECKLRTFRDLPVGVEAHDQLSEDRKAGYADTLMFLAERLDEVEPDLGHALENYLAERDREERGSYGVMLVSETAAWDEDVLDRIEEKENRLHPLHVRVLLAADLANLVERVYDSIGAEVIDDGT